MARTDGDGLTFRLKDEVAAVTLAKIYVIIRSLSEVLSKSIHFLRNDYKKIIIVGYPHFSKMLKLCFLILCYRYWFTMLDEILRIICHLFQINLINKHWDIWKIYFKKYVFGCGMSKKTIRGRHETLQKRKIYFLG